MSVTLTLLRNSSRMTWEQNNYARTGTIRVNPREAGKIVKELSLNLDPPMSPNISTYRKGSIPTDKIAYSITFYNSYVEFQIVEVL